jgi:hypothetical protein
MKRNALCSKMERATSISTNVTVARAKMARDAAIQAQTSSASMLSRALAALAG